MRHPITSSTRTRPVVVVTVILSILVGWVLFVVLLGTLGGTETASSRDDGSGAAASSGRAGSDDPDGGAEEEGEGSSGSYGDYSEGDYGEDGEPEDGEPEDGEPEDGEPENGEPEDSGSTATPTDAADPGNGEDPETQNLSSRPSDAVVEDATDEDLEPYAIVPTGDDDQTEDLTEEEAVRARTASEQFLSAAYGYTGTSNDDYLDAVERITAETIYDSPGGERLQGYAQAAPECGMRSTAVLDEFEVVAQAPEGLAASVSFTVHDGPDSHAFNQEQVLRPTEDGNYEVVGVSVEELTSDTEPRETCPGNPPGEGGELDDDEAAEVERAVREHYEQLGRAEFEEAYTNFGPSYRALVPHDLWVDAHLAEGVEDSTIHSIEVDTAGGHHATADVAVGFTDSAGHHEFELSWQLVAEDGRWKLDVQTAGAKVDTDRRGDQ